MRRGLGGVLWFLASCSSNGSLPQDAAPEDAAFDEGAPDATLCGNGILDPGEACDGDVVGGESCVSRGFANGTLRCRDCSAIDQSNCGGIVLPGFSPLSVTGTTVQLSTGRSYAWAGDSYLPAVSSRGAVLASSQVLMIDGTALVPSTVDMTEAADDHAVISATGTTLFGKLALSVVTRVEYDGAAFVTITLTPSGSVTVPSFTYRAAIAHASPYMTMNRYDLFEMAPSTNRPILRQQSRDRTFSPIAWDGNFQNVMQFHDGQKSFSWFADNAKGWIWNNGAHVTQVTDGGIGASITFAQNIIGASADLSAPMVVEFGFMATPVKSLDDPSWRVQLAPVQIYSVKGAQYGKIGTWWQDFFCLETLPYVPCPAATLADSGMSAANATASQGWTVANKLAPELSYGLGFGIDRLPYFATQITPIQDPDLRAHMSDWMVDWTPNPSWPNPFLDSWQPSLPDSFERAMFSQTPSAYTDWRIERLDTVLTNFGTPGPQGIYLDQHQTVDSVGAFAWTDSNGVTRPSLDLLGMRHWLKKLRTLFFKHGRKGVIYAHDSAQEIAPMNSFASVTMDGEGFTGPSLVPGNNDYALMSAEYWRTSFAGASELGVPVTVLLNRKGYDATGAITGCLGGNQPQSDPRCYLTQSQVRQFLAQLLLLDGLLGINGMVAQQIIDWVYPAYDVLQWLPYTATDSIFSGYWAGGTGATCSVPCYASYYQRKPNQRAVIVVSNLSTDAGPMDVAVDGVQLVGAPAVFTDGETGTPLTETGGHISVATGAKNFKLIQVTAQ